MQTKIKEIALNYTELRNAEGICSNLQFELHNLTANNYDSADRYLNMRKTLAKLQKTISLAARKNY